jgi:pilus retraction protein PilT
MSSLRELLSRATALGASDIHLKPRVKPLFRVDGELQADAGEALAPSELDRLAAEVVPPHLQTRFRNEHEADFALVEDGVGRFRVNVFVAGGEPAFAIRYVKSKIPTFEELHLPPVLRRIALLPRGIVLATGTTGCGKSTTLATIIQHINENDRRRIITIEDPVEYVFDDDKSAITQREVGIDTLSFHAGLRHVMRQDPDVIMIGEMRDAESFLAALTAAETGHLVLSTLHTSNAALAIPRILDYFPASERDKMRMSLADTLQCVFCQRLIPSIRGGVRPAVELMISTPTVRKLIEKNAMERLNAAIETGTEDGMQTFNQAVYRLIRGGDVTEQDGMQNADNPEALRMNLKGIFLDESRRILSG